MLNKQLFRNNLSSISLTTCNLFKIQKRYKSKITYYTFSKEHIKRHFDDFTSKCIVSLRDLIQKNHLDKKDLCFSLVTINGDEYLSKLDNNKKSLNDNYIFSVLLHSFQVLFSIKRMGYYNWNKNSLKLDFDFCFKHFYLKNNSNMAFLLMSNKILDDNSLVKKYSNQLNDKKISSERKKQLLNLLINESLKKDLYINRKLINNK